MRGEVEWDEFARFVVECAGFAEDVAPSSVRVHDGVVGDAQDDSMSRGNGRAVSGGEE